MLEYFAAARRGVGAALEACLASMAPGLGSVSADLGADAASRLARFGLRGKMLRGCLVRLGYELASGRRASGRDDGALDRAGAAMELFQSGLLVHDDIMDRDRVRRGLPSMHAEYEGLLAAGGYADPAHGGEALGICAGDLAYFAAFGLLAGLPADAGRAAGAVAIAAAELSLVAAAQMQDVANGAARPASANPFRQADAEPSEADILALYRYKTGRYTFSLPLALGAAIAGAPEAARLSLEAAGESMGVLFQLKDDELGLFADESELGKPLGADLRENKKTLFRLRLLERADGASAGRLRAVYGKGELRAEDLEFVRAQTERLGVRAEMRALMADYARAAEERLAPLLDKAPAEAAAAFRELAAYSLDRKS